MEAMAALQSSMTGLSLPSNSFLGHRLSILRSLSPLHIKPRESPCLIVVKLKRWEQKECKPNSLPVLHKMHFKECQYQREYWGTENLLKSCLKSNTVKRVVFTSSIGSITAKDSNGNWRSVDESCQTKFDHVLNAKASGWVYVLSKLLTEAAFKFAYENAIDLVSVITATVGGDPKYFLILSAVNARMGSVALVHIEDMQSSHISDGASQGGRLEAEEESSKHPEISSKKLKDLGFIYKHGIEDIIHQSLHG